MAKEHTNAPLKWFWAVSTAALFWNLIGVAAFFGRMTLDLTALSDAERAFHEATPVWATFAFGVAVFGGSLGCAALLLRKSWAYPMLVVSLLGIVLQITHSLIIGNGLEVFGSAGLVLPALTFSIGAALVWFARDSRGRGWLTTTDFPA